METEVNSFDKLIFPSLITIPAKPSIPGKLLRRFTSVPGVKQERDPAEATPVDPWLLKTKMVPGFNML